jgi:glucokinase
VTEVVAVDIGGTHARFALAEVEGGQVTRLDEDVTFKTAEHASLQTAWEAFGERLGRSLPPAAGIAFAGPVQGDLLKLTNNPWVIRPALIKPKLGVDAYVLVNDFGAVGHAVARLGEEHFLHLAGPKRPLAEESVVSIVGPGTGLGVAQLVRRGGRNHVVETEGGHIDFAPLDGLEDRILDQLRKRYRRVSVERIVSGMGLANIHEALAAIEDRSIRHSDDKALWKAALEGGDSLAAAALDRFCLSLGAVAGDLALAHGATAVVIAGGLGLRLADHLPQSGFRDRFIAKGRFERRMEQIPVKLITYPEPGLFGAAAAFAEEHP